MATQITKDDVDKVVKEAVKFDFDEITNRLKTMQNLLEQDLELDKKQKIELPDTESKLVDVYSKLDEIKIGIKLLRDEIQVLKQQHANLERKIEEVA